MTAANDDALDAAWGRRPAGYDGVRRGEERRAMMSVGTTTRAAVNIAATSGRRVLALTGRVDGPGFLPGTVSGHSDGFILRGMLPYTMQIPTVLLEVVDEDALCAVIDDLQMRGGYRAEVYAPDGSRDPRYRL